jgi:hypothetical protein
MDLSISRGVSNTRSSTNLYSLYTSERARLIDVHGTVNVNPYNYCPQEKIKRLQARTRTETQEESRCLESYLHIQH